MERKTAILNEPDRWYSARAVHKAHWKWGPMKYQVIIYWSKDDNAFIAEVPELSGCMADGATKTEALAASDRVAQEWIETAKELDRVVPEPKGRLAFA